MENMRVRGLVSRTRGVHLTRARVRELSPVLSSAGFMCCGRLDYWVGLKLTYAGKFLLKISVGCTSSRRRSVHSSDAAMQ